MPPASPQTAQQRAVQAQVDRLLLEQGEYQPLALLLQQRCLGYDDYEAWRDGRLACLDGALDGDRQSIRQQLSDAADYLQRRGWERVALRYLAWHPAPASPARPSLRFSSESDIDAIFHCGYQRPRDQPQLDLFSDAPATSLANGITEALGERDPGEARRLLGRLAGIAPDHRRLPELECLTAAAESADQPVRDVRAELHWLQATVVPLAGRLLGRNRHNLLVPLWRRLSRAVEGRPYDPADADCHLSHTAAGALDWCSVRRAVESESGWADEPVLLRRHAEACERSGDDDAALADWCRLCWRFPQLADALTESSDPSLQQLWSAFQDLDPLLPAHTFPAWLLIRRPGLSRRLTIPGSHGPSGCPDSYHSVRRLQLNRITAASADNPGSEMALRAELQRQDPLLFRHYLAALPPSD